MNKFGISISAPFDKIPDDIDSDYKDLFLFNKITNKYIFSFYINCFGTSTAFDLLNSYLVYVINVSL